MTCMPIGSEDVYIYIYNVNIIEWLIAKKLHIRPSTHINGKQGAKKKYGEAKAEAASLNCV